MLFYNPSTSLEFRAAILAARPGDVILLHPKEYRGRFFLGPLQFPHFGDREQLPITIQGSYSSDFRKTTTIVAPRNDTAIFITGGKWRLSGLNVISEYSGVHIMSRGHTLRDINFRRTEYAVSIRGDNNRIEDANIFGSRVAIRIHGNGNCIKNSVLSQVKYSGIIIYWTSTGNTIESTTVIMKKRKKIRKKKSIFMRLMAYLNSILPNTGWSLILYEGSSGTQIKGSTFSGVADMYGDGGRVKGCKFTGLNLGGNGNTFSDTEIRKLFRDPEGKENTFLASCKIKQTTTWWILFT